VRIGGLPVRIEAGARRRPADDEASTGAGGVSRAVRIPVRIPVRIEAGGRDDDERTTTGAGGVRVPG